MCLVFTASLCDGRLCHVQLILIYDISCASLSDHMKLVYNVLAPLLGLLVFNWWWGSWWIPWWNLRMVFGDQRLRLVLVQTCNHCLFAPLCLKRCSRAASFFDGRLCHVQLILTYSVSCVSLSDRMKLGIWNRAIGGFVAIHVYSILEYWLWLRST